MSTVRHILCPIDFSPTSDAALSYALEMAARLDAKVTVLHAYQLPTYSFPEGGFIPNASWVAEIMDESQRELDSWVAEKQLDSRVKISAKLCQGSPFAEISEAAEALEADLIIMGTHGRTGLSHLLLGSVAERVLRTSSVPVLTVRSPDGELRASA